jgi:hypothetical protein
MVGRTPRSAADAPVGLLTPRVVGQPILAAAAFQAARGDRAPPASAG